MTASYVCGFCKTRVISAPLNLPDESRRPYPLILEETPKGDIGTVMIRDNGKAQLIGPAWFESLKADDIQTYIQHSSPRCDQMKQWRKMQRRSA